MTKKLTPKSAKKAVAVVTQEKTGKVKKAEPVSTNKPLPDLLDTFESRTGATYTVIAIDQHLGATLSIRPSSYLLGAGRGEFRLRFDFAKDAPPMLPDWLTYDGGNDTYKSSTCRLSGGSAAIDALHTLLKEKLPDFSFTSANQFRALMRATEKVVLNLGKLTVEDGKETCTDKSDDSSLAGL